MEQTQTRDNLWKIPLKNCLDVKLSGEMATVLQFAEPDVYSIYKVHLISAECCLIAEYKDSFRYHSPIDISENHIYTINVDESCIQMFDHDGRSVDNYDFSSKFESPSGLLALNDKTLAITDYDTGSVVKVNLKKKGMQVLWKCEGLSAPAALCSSDDGLMFVCSLWGKKLYVVSSEGKLI